MMALVHSHMWYLVVSALPSALSTHKTDCHCTSECFLIMTLRTIKKIFAFTILIKMNLRMSKPFETSDPARRGKPVLKVHTNFCDLSCLLTTKLAIGMKRMARYVVRANSRVWLCHFTIE